MNFQLAAWDSHALFVMQNSGRAKNSPPVLNRSSNSLSVVGRLRSFFPIYLRLSTPDLLAHLLTAVDSRGRAFRDNIRAYNSALAFASLGVSLDRQLTNAKR